MNSPACAFVLALLFKIIRCLFPSRAHPQIDFLFIYFSLNPIPRTLVDTISNNPISPAMQLGSGVQPMQVRTYDRPGLLSTLTLAFFFALVIVLPNSVRPIKAALFPLLAMFCYWKTRRIDTELLIVWGLIAFVSIFYLVYPPQPKLTTGVFAQFGLVYVASPLFWILICDYVVRTYSFETISNFLFWCTVAALGSVILFFYLFLNYGAESVSLFMATEHANVKYETDKANFKATMHVFGSLIFIGSAFIASDTLGFFKKAGIVVVLVTIALVSGRDALTFCLIMGAGIFVFFRYLDFAKQKLSVTAILISAIIASAVFTEVGNLAISNLVEKVQNFGGSERKAQFTALMRGIQETWLLGAGHTASVSVVRHVDKPWRYELLPLALTFRVGLIGVLIYAYPFLSSVWRMVGLVRAGCENQVDIFFFTGLVATMLATSTNPYLESFEFQWCLFLPFCYFHHRKINA
jgi:drug/metabolite transporter superfamily protein YnfA